MAVLQAFVLRRRLTQPGWWIVAGGVGGVLGSFASTYVNATVFAAFGVHGIFVATLLLTALGVGILLGTLQWLVLRRQVLRAFWWVPASCLGMVAGTVVGGFVAGVALSIVSDGLGQEPGLITANITTGFVGATLHAAITGSALIRLLQSPAPIAEDALPTLR